MSSAAHLYREALRVEPAAAESTLREAADLARDASYQAALVAAGGCVQRAAAALGVSRRHLYTWLLAPGRAAELESARGAAGFEPLPWGFKREP